MKAKLWGAILIIAEVSADYILINWSSTAL